VIIPFATNSYKSVSLPLSSERTINVYAEREPPDAKSQVAVFGAPGLMNFATCGTGPVRGMWVMGGVLYVVSGVTLYSVTSLGVATSIGGAISGNGPVSMSDNGTQLLIVNGVLGYIYSVGTGFQVITSTNFHASKSCTFFDNYFVLSWDGTNKFFISGSLDGTSYSGTDFASAEVSPDYVLAVVNQQENLLVFGQKTIETWYDAGTINFPFQRIDGGTIERGCAAALTPVKEDNSVFFLGDDLVFYRLDGTIPRRISTHAIEDAWQQYSSVSDAFTFSYTFEGHKFIVLTFPTGNATWVFDISTGLWHERDSVDINNNSFGRWRGNCCQVAYNKILIGDAYSGVVGYIDGTTYTEFGNMIRGIMVSPIVSDPDRKRVFHSRFELDIEQGVGTTVNPGADPQISLDWSDDGGRTFKPMQLWHSMGKIGAYTKRLRWLRLGQSRNRMYRATISDPVRRTIIAASASLSVGI
jgi:hypothetical protein